MHDSLRRLQEESGEDTGGTDEGGADELGSSAGVGGWGGASHGAGASWASWGGAVAVAVWLDWRDGGAAWLGGGGHALQWNVSTK